MKKTLVFVCVVLLGACSDPEPIRGGPVRQERTAIEGLKLEFIESEVESAALSINFINESEGYITCYDGYIYKSTDGGEQWRKVAKEIYQPINDVCFSTPAEGWAVGGRSDCEGTNCVQPPGFILHSRDNGEHWEKISLEISKRVNLKSVWFINEDIGFAVGQDMILRTIDGGDNWTETIMDELSGDMSTVEFFDDKNGLINGTMGIVVRTEDGGDSWQVSKPFPQSGENSLSLTGDIAFSAGYTSMHRSTDFGKTWNPLPTFTENIYTVNFVSETRGFAFGRGNYSGGDFGYSMGAIYYTNDGGQTWKGSSEVHENETIISSASPGQTTAFGLSHNGTVVKITVK